MADIGYHKYYSCHTSETEDNYVIRITGNEYQISIRSCHEKFPANEIAKYLCRDIGNGGGHRNKAGGQIQREKMQSKYGQKEIIEVINDLICQYISEYNIS